MKEKPCKLTGITSVEAGALSLSQKPPKFNLRFQICASAAGGGAMIWGAICGEAAGADIS